MSVTNQGKTRSLYASGDLSAKKYHIVYQNAATTVAIAGTAQNTAECVLYVLQNEPTSGQQAEVLELGTGNSYAVVGDASSSIGDEMMISSAGKLVARSGAGVPAIARMRTATTVANQIAEVDTMRKGGETALVGLTSSVAELNILTGVTATAAEINAVADKSTSVVNTTAATLALTAALHGQRIVTVNKADGAALTLPAATGTGNKYTVIIGTAITSNSTTIKAASATDSFAGMALGVDTDAEGATGYTWNADSGDDTVTMSGTATGGKIGDVWTFIDFATGLWLVEGRITQSGGSEATPFSATVS